MTCGTFTTSRIPDGQQDTVAAGYQLDNPLRVTKTQAEDGTWTVTAAFPPPAGHPCCERPERLRPCHPRHAEASIGNNVERRSVAYCALSRMTGDATQVSELWKGGEFAHNQEPTAEIVALASAALARQFPDPTGGATFFYSPRSMPKEGDDVSRMDVGGGLEFVPPLTVRNYRPSWTKTMTLVSVPGFDRLFSNSINPNVDPAVASIEYRRSPTPWPIFGDREYPKGGGSTVDHSLKHSAVSQREEGSKLAVSR